MSAKQLDLGVMPKQDAASRVGRVAFAAILDARKGNTSFRLTEETLIECLRPALAKELPKAMRVNGRNLLFDALAEACGYVEPFTKSAAGQVAKAIKEIREADPLITPDELRRVALAVRRKYESAGPMAVSAHLHEFRNVGRVKSRPALPVAPVGWLKKLRELYPDSQYAPGGLYEDTPETDYQWSQLDPSVRKTVMEAMP